jgi:hypothetical protein
LTQNEHGSLKIREDMIDWLEQEIEPIPPFNFQVEISSYPQSWHWNFIRDGDQIGVEFWFKNMVDAMLFKMSWFNA